MEYVESMSHTLEFRVDCIYFSCFCSASMSDFISSLRYWDIDSWTLLLNSLMHPTKKLQIKAYKKEKISFRVYNELNIQRHNCLLIFYCSLLLLCFSALLTKKENLWCKKGTNEYKREKKNVEIEEKQLPI